MIDRRLFIKTSVAAATTPVILGKKEHRGPDTSGVLGPGQGASPGAAPTIAPMPQPSHKPFLSLKWGMVNPGPDATVHDKFALVKELGYDGIELDSPGGPDINEAVAASRALDLPIHGVVNSIHWSVRLSDPEPGTRERAVEGLQTAIKDSHAYGGTAVLLVPGRVTNAETENHDQVWQRSIEGIRECLPLASKLGIYILIENVWNGFCYTHDGPNDQPADQLAAYLDEINSPWVGSYFDIGNHQKYGKPEEWIRTLGRRIVKVDVKDWGIENGWAKIGDGDINWPEVCNALQEIGFHGWATAEVGGGGRERLAEVKQRMDDVFAPLG